MIHAPGLVAMQKGTLAVDGTVLLVVVGLLLVLGGVAAFIVLRRVVVPGVEGAINTALEPGVRKFEIAIFSRSAFGDSVHYLRQLGFFAGTEDLSDIDLAREIAEDAEHAVEMAKVSNLSGAMRRARNPAAGTSPRNWLAAASTPLPDSWMVDLIVASFDRNRVWWQDRDRVYRGQDGIAATIREWGLISRGAFQPEDIVESWGEDGEMIVVSFSLNGEEHSYIHLTSLDTYVDTVGLRDSINPLITDSGYQIVICEVRGDPNVVLFLTDDERRRLAEERGWRFVEWSSLVA